MTLHSTTQYYSTLQHRLFTTPYTLRGKEKSSDRASHQFISPTTMRCASNQNETLTYFSHVSCFSSEQEDTQMIRLASRPTSKTILTFSQLLHLFFAVKEQALSSKKKNLGYFSEL